MLTKQMPIGSGFGAATNAAEVIPDRDLSEKTVMVTGGYSGLGRETVRVLRSAGAKVIVPARDIDKAAKALEEIEGIEIEKMDLLDPASIDAFAKNFLASGRSLNILINSAGIMACPLSRDPRGYELHFATNHLGHFHLTARLWPALRQAKGSRVVSVSSWGHRFSPVVFDDPNFERRRYDRWMAYGQSKTANILFALALDMRGKDEGIRAFSLHPGSINGTGLERHLTQEELMESGTIDKDGNPILDPTRNLKTVEQGASTSVWCATSPLLDDMGGVYCENCDISPLVSEEAKDGKSLDATSQAGVMPYAVDPEAADRLWSLSETLTGVAVE